MSVKIELVCENEDEAIIVLSFVRQGRAALAKRKQQLLNPPALAATGSDPASATVTDTTPAQASSSAPSQPVTEGTEPKPTRQRKARADKGQQRGPNSRTQEANGAGASAPADTAKSAIPGDATAGSTPAPQAAPAPAASSETAAPQTEGDTTAQADKATNPTTTAAAAAPSKPLTLDDVQVAVEKMFAAKDYDATLGLLGRFGVKRGKDLPADQWANFINRVNGVVDRGEAI